MNTILVVTFLNFIHSNNIFVPNAIKKLCTCFAECPAYKTNEIARCNSEQEDRRCLKIIPAVIASMIFPLLLGVFVFKQFLRSVNRVGVFEFISSIIWSKSNAIRLSKDLSRQRDENLSEHIALISRLRIFDMALTIVFLVMAFCVHMLENDL